jgi:hypothetical protein
MDILKKFGIFTIEILCSMTYKIVCPVQNNQVIVPLPADFRNKSVVTVYVDDSVDVKSQKMAEMSQAAKDPLFLEDVEEIQRDFDFIEDFENL